MIKPRCGSSRLFHLFTRFTLTAVFTISCLPANALTISPHISDNMVLQRNKPITISGSATEGAKISVSFLDQTTNTSADEKGAWTVTLDPIPASTTPAELNITSDKSTPVTLKNIVVGDVFLVARQTSIDISLGRDAEGIKVAKAHKNNSLLRAISIKTIPAATPLRALPESATSGWTEVDKESSLTMTAASYYLGRDLAATSDIPIGIMDLNLGSAFPLSWLSREALEETEKFYGGSDVPGQLKYHDERLAAERDGVPFRKEKEPPIGTVQLTLFPSGGYNGALHPLKNTALKAALVQLGNDYPYMIYEDIDTSSDPFNLKALNDAYVDTYNIRKNGFRMEPKTLPRFPREWRKTLGEENLPFGLILPPGSELNTLGQHHREMRELQRIMAEGNANVGVILPGSENITFSAQPSDEELLAQRCASWVRGAVIHDATIPTGPLFDCIVPHFNEATIHFKKGTAKGLKAEGDALDYFEAAGVGGDYTPAKARIMGETIHIKSDTVPRISRVRYNWNQRPNQQLINAAGLPAIPFRSEEAEYVWFVRNEDDDLPMEYSTPANEWAKNDVTLINGQLQTHGYGNFTGWIGPAGFRTGPFGPNMGVRKVKQGSPADGKVFEGDVIYSANGNMLGDKAWEVMGAAITESETREAEGKLVLGLRRDGKNMDVELTLEVMGTYSPTAPYDCPKTEKIIGDLERWLIQDGAGAGYLNTDALFMLATGNPELQGYVRRIVYKILEKKLPDVPIDGRKAGKSWYNSAEALLLSEYYLATGDTNVLAHLKFACDRLAATQNKEFGGWRHNFPGGAHYGLIPNAGLPGAMGMNFAIKAGVDIDMDSYHLAIKHFEDKRADSGYLIYGYGKLTMDKPPVFDPEKILNGKMDSFNGGLSAAAILMNHTGNYKGAHLTSMISAYAWNNTFGGHGGNFWNNFWTPLGAQQHSKNAFIHFWRNYRWYRESNRMFDGSLIQHESGKVGAGCGVALVAPRERLRITGAPDSPFETDAPESLKPALEAYRNKDYVTAAKRGEELLASGTVGKDIRPTVVYFLQQANDITASIEADLERISKLAAEGKIDEAKSFIPGLKGILPVGDKRSEVAQATIASAKPASKQPKQAKTQEVTEQEGSWVRLVSERPTKDKDKGPDVSSQPEAFSIWKIKIVEDLSQAPEDWAQPGFDDSDWKETSLPISWRMYHTALLRTTFNVDNKNAFDALRLYAWVFRQQGIEIYLNGKLIGKVNNIEKKTGNIENEFKESALKHLRKGKNTLAVTTRHNWRWGMLFMKVYNDGFDFNLDARLKDER